MEKAKEQKTEKLYCGENTGPGPQSIIVMKPDGSSYPLRHIERHSPDGFQWGYGGSGPADAALSILADCIGEEEAKCFYQSFKWEFIAGAGKILKIAEKDILHWFLITKAKLRGGSS